MVYLIKLIRILKNLDSRIIFQLKNDLKNQDFVPNQVKASNNNHEVYNRHFSILFNNLQYKLNKDEYFNK